MIDDDSGHHPRSPYHVPEYVTSCERCGTKLEAFDECEEVTFTEITEDEDAPETTLSVCEDCKNWLNKNKIVL